MGFFMFLLFVLIIVIAVFSLALIWLTKNGSFNQVIKFLNKYLIFIFVLLFILYLVTIISTAFLIQSQDLLVIVFFKLIIQLTFFALIFVDSKSLLHNLKNDDIFVDTNAKLTKQIGTNFIYLSVIEIISGLTLGVLKFIADSTFKEFRFETSTTLILFLVIGLILLIISTILKKAIEIYKEHNLTI